MAVVTSSYPREGDDAAGHFVRLEALALARDGHRVHVIAPGAPGRDTLLGGDGIHLWPAGGGDAFGSPGVLARLRARPRRALGVLAFGLGVRRRLQQIGHVDQLIAHWLLPSALPWLVSQPAPLEIVCHGSDVRLLVALGRAPCRLLVSTLLGRGASFRFAAEASREALRARLGAALGRRLDQASLVRAPALDVPAVDPNARARWREQLAPDPGQALVAVVGRLVQSKRVDLAIEAAARLHPSPALVVVGDGPERHRLQALARAEGGRCHFAGQQPRALCLAMMAAADVLLHPSAEEGAPTVVREARALGLPVVSCGAGDVARWARDDALIRVTAPEPAELASALAASLGPPAAGRSLGIAVVAAPRMT